VTDRCLTGPRTAKRGIDRRSAALTSTVRARRTSARSKWTRSVAVTWSMTSSGSCLLVAPTLFPFFPVGKSMSSRGLEATDGRGSDGKWRRGPKHRLAGDYSYELIYSAFTAVWLRDSVFFESVSLVLKTAPVSLCAYTRYWRRPTTAMRIRLYGWRVYQIISYIRLKELWQNPK